MTYFSSHTSCNFRLLYTVFHSSETVIPPLKGLLVDTKSTISCYSFSWKLSFTSKAPITRDKFRWCKEGQSICNTFIPFLRLIQPLSVIPPLQCVIETVIPPLKGLIGALKSVVLCHSLFLRVIHH